MEKNRVLGASGIALVSLLLSGCAGDVTWGEDPNWKISMSQQAEASEMAINSLGETEPQFKTDKFSATFVPLGVANVGDKKITTFAMSADLPNNCMTRENQFPSNAGEACVDFVYGSRTALLEQEGKDYQAPLHRGSGRTFIETTNGISTFKLVTPADADATSIYLIADGESVTLDPATGRPHGDTPDKKYPTHPPAQEPAAK